MNIPRHKIGINMNKIPIKNYSAGLIIKFGGNICKKIKKQKRRSAKIHTKGELKCTKKRK